MPVGPAALPADRVGVQGPAHEQPVPGDGLDAEQVAVSQGPAGLAGLGAVVVASADDQVTGAGPDAVGDGDRGPAGDDAKGDQVVADAAVQLAAQRVIGGHQQGVGATRRERGVGGRSGVHDLLGIAADDAAVLVVGGQHARIAVTQPQAGGLFPGVAEPDGFGQPGIAQRSGEQGHAAAVFHRLQLADVPGQDDLGTAGPGVGDQVGQVRAGQHRGLIDDQERAGADGDGAAGAARPGRWPRNCAALYETGTPAARVLRADWDGVIPITGPSPALAQIRAASASTRVFPAPAGALITETSRPSTSTASAAAA
jgi:hypothetical protein